MKLLAFFLIAVLSLSSSDGVTLICPQPQQCNTSTLTATCQISSNVIVWSRNGDHLVSYTFTSSIGSSNTFDGFISTVLVSRNPTTSTFTVNVGHDSFEGISISCTNGLNGQKKHCTIQTI
uniref:Ig-like domain-containing protein n=1 Tax=Amphimedon queenslandica TaxID=400682 RepID=A0A1X7TBZ9_AMPQE